MFQCQGSVVSSTSSVTTILGIGLYFYFYSIKHYSINYLRISRFVKYRKCLEYNRRTQKRDQMFIKDLGQQVCLTSARCTYVSMADLA